MGLRWAPLGRTVADELHDSRAASTKAKLCGRAAVSRGPGGRPLNLVQEFWNRLSQASGGLQALGQIVTFAGMLFGVWRVVRGARQPATVAAFASAASSADLTSRPAAGVPRRWAAEIATAGVTHDTPLSRIIALRTTNIVAMVCAIEALGWVVLASLLSLDPRFVVVDGLVFMGCCAALAANQSGRYDLARFGVLGAITLQFLVVLVSTPLRGGTEYFIVALIALPILIFERAEKRKLMLSYAVMAPLAVAGVVVHEVWGRWTIIELPSAGLTVGYYANAVILCLIMTVVSFYYVNGALRNYALLDVEHQQSSQLLRDLLPGRVVEQMHQGGNSSLASHGDATVLFAQVSGLANFAQRVSPIHFVQILNRIFCEFDRLLEANGVEKIKTFGANYLGACGIDDVAREDQAVAVARTALAMRDVITRLGAELDLPLGLRIGIGTGGAVSGVIGEVRQTFDVWGETVEIAKAVEGLVPGSTILISEATYQRVRAEFDTSEAPLLEVAGIGPVRAHLLLAEKRAVGAT
jgi:class 3 adenylate cyclase